VIQLDNNDIIISTSGKYYNILIYRLKGDKYSLFQEIKEDRKGYKMQETRSGCIILPKEFELKWLKKLSKNKFISISNYGFKIYSLNQNNQYSIILMDTHLEEINKIYEINENTFIFGTDEYIDASLGGPAHNYLLLEKVELKKIEINEINEKLKSIKDKNNDVFGFFLYDEDKNEEFDENELENKIKSLKLIHFSKKLFEYAPYYGEFNRFSDFIILKNKYLLISAGNMILIFDILEGKKLDEFTIIEEGENNLYLNHNINIQKWNNSNDNEFIIIEEGNIFLFELNENSPKDIELKIIAYSYCPDINGLIKIGEENRFYINKNDHILIY
jgi:hypothetical protein